MALFRRLLSVDVQLVLFKLKPGVCQEQIDCFCEAGRQMVGKIDGSLSPQSKLQDAFIE